MPIPTEVVGSLPRPSYLQQAFADYDAGKKSRADLTKAQDKAAEDSIKLMEEAGEPLVTDGEQRASSYAVSLRQPPPPKKKHSLTLSLDSQHTLSPSE
ncbi:hypothetical protein GP486_005379 [Trichoglossum hirsutum]|uniref:Uncharacterized protein n=1 Tax=Trichoglossum hirsutum TaxID=265104 RepID=A0A9P8L9D1_9PEZI|nr:hypothetical protein GP486_005379 [Trichoglossum hirsutum]